MTYGPIMRAYSMSALGIPKELAELTQESRRRSGRSRLMWAILGILLAVGPLLAIGTLAMPGLWDTLFRGGNV